MNYDELSKTLHKAVDRAIEGLSEHMEDQGVVLLDVTGTCADEDEVTTTTASFVIAGLADDTWRVDELTIKCSRDSLEVCDDV